MGSFIDWGTLPTWHWMTTKLQSWKCPIFLFEGAIHSFPHLLHQSSSLLDRDSRARFRSVPVPYSSLSLSSPSSHSYKLTASYLYTSPQFIMRGIVLYWDSYPLFSRFFVSASSLFFLLFLTSLSWFPVLNVFHILAYCNHSGHCPLLLSCNL